MTNPRPPRQFDRLAHRTCPARVAYCLWAGQVEGRWDVGIVEGDLPNPLPDNLQEAATQFGNWDLIREEWRIATRQRTTRKETIYPPVALHQAIAEQAKAEGLAWGKMAVKMLQSKRVVGK